MAAVKYHISKSGEFVIENYNLAPTFSSFFPGIAGPLGIPMWVFYCNRGQCITSFGIHDKDGSIMEFHPANKAYKNVSLNGFRTFIKVNGKPYEPFRESSGQPNRMRINPHDLTIEEVNSDLKLKVSVNYFTMPNENFPALVRTLTVKNTSKKKAAIELIDGMPSIVPNGFAHMLLKNMSQTIEAWCMVENLERNAPFFRLKVVPSDAPETKLNQRGNFYLSFASKSSSKLPVKVMVNPKSVFGHMSSLESPDAFNCAERFSPPKNEVTDGFIPAAFSHLSVQLGKEEEIELISVIGNIESVDALNVLRNRVLDNGIIAEKRAENEQLIKDMTSAMHTASSSNSFDLYSRQSYLDNVMRGGLAIDIGGRPFYVYYRKHGDMERDYNDFKVMPSYFSQGSGNYRDMDQNRRNDVFFDPTVAASNIMTFFNLIQLDGFNPLVVLGSRYCVDNKAKADDIIKKHLRNAPKRAAESLQKPFILGSLIKDLEESGARFTGPREAFAADLILSSARLDDAAHGDGFWTDHFFYNIDLLESFECVFPERMKDLLLNERSFTFYDNENVVVERTCRHVKKDASVRQLRSVKADPEKRSLIAGRAANRNIVRTDSGKGDIYYTTLITKMLCIAANKAASFDAEGIGIEMEADKPDWYDALNGLPALFGSSLSETLELKRFCEFVLARTDASSKASIPVELKEFIDGLGQIPGEGFEYWDASNTLKESFRAKTRLGIGGEEAEVDHPYISTFLLNVIKKCDRAVKKVQEKYGNYYTYFINEAVEYETLSPSVKVKKFEQKPLPFFLEGFVHALKVEKDKNIYSLVKNSKLYDSKLKMYKVNAPLDDATIEIGRAKVFLPGWLENESVWLHMEYKYMLELLKAGLYDEFFSDLKDVLVPFMDPKVYKRSILENSSFISSSAYPDREFHGRGFVARLSGATAEFIDMWLIMMTGKRIFTLDKNGKLIFKLSPILPKWLFQGGKLRFRLFSEIDVEYIKKGKGDAFNAKAESYCFEVDGKPVEVKGPSVSEPYSKLIRERKVKKISVNLI